jgi:hypothetical protein
MFLNIVSHANMYLATKISHPKNKVDHEENMYLTQIVLNYTTIYLLQLWVLELFVLHLHGTFYCPSYQFKVLLKD